MWHIFREIRIRLIDGNQNPDIFPNNPIDLAYGETFHLLYRYYQARPFEPGRLERLDKAIELADTLIERKPDPWVYYMKASIFIELSRFSDGKSETYIKDAEKIALEAEKLDKGAYFGICGQISISKFEKSGIDKDLETALEYYKQWINYTPDSYNARFGAGFTLLLQKKYDEAVDQYEKGLSINRNPESQHFVLLGIAYSRPSAKGFSNPNKAKRYLEMALKPNQNNFLAYLYLTLIYSYENQMEKAHSYAKEILRTTPSFSLQRFRAMHRTDEPEAEAINRFHEELLKKAGIMEKRKK
jgi:tetratricopeptide (TPR) repeat protein